MLLFLFFVLVLWTGLGYVFFRWCYSIQEESGFSYPFRPRRKHLFYAVIGPLAWYDILVNGKDING